MSSYSEYPNTPPAGEPAAPSGPAGPSWPGPPGGSYGPGQARAREQYGAADQQQYGVQPYLPQPGYAAGMAQGQLTVAPRSPAISLIASFFIPGLGSMINNRVGIGILILGIYAVGLILSLFIIGVPIAVGAWIWGMVDGYQAAQAWNRAHGIIS
jgi:TM2 domain-containing membrane protein YozV